MKKTALTALAALATTFLFGDSITINGVKWTYKVTNFSKGYVQLGGGSESSRAISSLFPQVDAQDIPWTFENDGRYIVTAIGPYAFSGCTNLVGTVDIPKACKTVGTKSFNECSRIVQVNGMTNITSIGEYAFLNCTNLVMNGLDLSGTTIGKGAFFGCSKLTGRVILRQGLGTFVESFLGKTAVSRVDVPTSVKTMNAKVLFESSNLHAFVLPGPPSGTLNVVADRTFAGSKVLKAVLFGPTTKCVSSSRNLDNMLKDVNGCTIIVPRSGWDGVKFGGYNTKVVYYGAGDELDIRIDTIGNTISATIKGSSAIDTMNECAPLFRSCGWETVINSDVVIDNTVSIDPDLFSNAVVYKTSTQKQVDDVYDLLGGNVANVIFDCTEATQNLQMPGGTNEFVTVRMKPGVKYITKKREFTILIK